MIDNAQIENPTLTRTEASDGKWTHIQQKGLTRLQLDLLAIIPSSNNQPKDRTLSNLEAQPPDPNLELLSDNETFKNLFDKGSDAAGGSRSNLG